MRRNRSIDAFRGLAIVGMVFFTLTLRLSGDLPDLMQHNVRGSLHIGDFILPLFIFGSGLSLAYYISKRKKEEKRFVSSVLERFGLLAVVGILLSHFSAKGFLEMDEVMLIALLFLACTALYNLDWKILLGIVPFIDLAYLFFIRPGWLASMDPFTGHYLGGYAAAPFYMTVMIAGLIIGKGIVSKGLWCMNNILAIALISFLFFICWLFVPIEKLAVSPSFMMLSILVCFAVFVLIDKLIKALNGLGEIEYMGRKPLRYWIMMYVGFLIPLTLYAEHNGLSFPLSVDWLLAVLLSVCVMLVLWLASQGIDYYLSKNKKNKIERNAHP